MVLSMTMEPVGEGKTERDQYRSGRMKMLMWDFDYCGTHDSRPACPRHGRHRI